MLKPRRLVVPTLMVLGLSAAVRLYAIFAIVEIENVPIERVTENLERRAAGNPQDIETRLNLARVHAMAYAAKSETAPVIKRVWRAQLSICCSTRDNFVRVPELAVAHARCA